MNREYEAIIFDLGKVVIQFSLDLAFERWGEVYSRNPKDLSDRVTLDKMLCRYEKGEITTEECMAHFSELLDIPFEFAGFESGWNSIYLGITEGMSDLLGELKETHRLVALSNTNILHASKWSKLYESELSPFDRVFCSHEIGFRKPEPEAYRTVLEYLELPPQKVIFTDDIPDFVEGARRLGIDSILFRNTDQLRRELEQRDVL